jgi:DNA polymerase-1
MGSLVPPVVTTFEQLDELIEIVRRVGAFAFDVETQATLEHHPDLVEHFEKDFKEHVSGLKNKSPDIVQRAHDNLTDTYLKNIVVNPLRNEVFWIGIATSGRSWAIPMGHRVGILVEKEEIGDGSTVPPAGFRKVLKNGQESMAKARYVKPAVYKDPPKQLSRSDVFERLRPLFFSDIIKIGHNVKFDARSIAKYYGEVPPGPYVDTMITQHVVNENLINYSLETLIETNYGGHKAYENGGKLGNLVSTSPFDSTALYVHRDARWTWLLYKKLIQKVVAHKDLIRAMELDNRVLEVLMHVENEGIPVDSSNLIALGVELDKELQDVLNSLLRYAPLGFNPDSNKHKQDFLFSKKTNGGLGLKPYKTTGKGAPSVDEESLKSLKHKHPVVPMLLTWAELKKLKSTYVDGLLPKLYKNRLHPSFHLHRTATGRLSSSDPNLQNIPRTSNIRKLFVANKDNVLLVADYDQIELRIMAMFSQDKRLLHTFANEEDIHTATASAVFKKKPGEITAEERQIGKGVNFLTAYGGGSVKLSRVTGISEKDAQEILNNYYRTFSELTSWKRVLVEKAKKDGFVSTLYGRRRRLPDLLSKDKELRARAERQAVNAIVQGTAADLCKQAMVDVYSAMKNTSVKLVVQVHDELVATVDEHESAQIITPFLEAMGDGKIIDKVPIKVSYQFAKSWAEAKE